MHLLGLDVGTTGCKALVFDREGRIVGRARREYDVICTAPGMGEQDARLVWKLIIEALRELSASGATREVKALSVSVQGDAVIPVAAGFEPLQAALLGMDYRSEGEARLCEKRFGAFELFERTGMRPHPMNSLTKVLYLRTERPEVFERAWKMVTYADYVLGRFGAEAVIDHTMASRTMAFDVRSGVWSGEILGGLGLEAALFSRPVPSGTVVGMIGGGLAAETGLPQDVVLVTGGHDQTCAALGAGLVMEGTGLVSTGTAEVLSAALGEAKLSREMFERYYPCYLHAKAGMYFTFSLNHVGGLLLKWYRDALCPPEVGDARGMGGDVYGLIDERMPEGPTGLMVLPHFHGSGTPWCDLESKGAIVGLTLATTRHEVAKALLEGLTFELLINLESLEACGVGVGELVAAGGGANSARWLQLKADILGRPIRTLRCREAACLGAALLAGCGIGVYDSLDEAVRNTVRFDGEYRPERGVTEVYRARYGTYRRLYPTLRGLGGVD
jgi:xylulokinase